MFLRLFITSTALWSSAMCGRLWQTRLSEAALLDKKQLVIQFLDFRQKPPGRTQGHGCHASTELRCRGFKMTFCLCRRKFHIILSVTETLSCKHLEALLNWLVCNLNEMRHDCKLSKANIPPESLQELCPVRIKFWREYVSSSKESWYLSSTLSLACVSCTPGKKRQTHPKSPQMQATSTSDQQINCRHLSMSVCPISLFGPPSIRQIQPSELRLYSVAPEQPVTFERLHYTSSHRNLQKNDWVPCRKVLFSPHSH